jgi:hypothetical protein
MLTPIQLTDTEPPEFPELKLPSEHIDLFSSEYQEGTEELKLSPRSATPLFQIGEELETEQVSTPTLKPFLERGMQEERSIASITIPTLEGLDIHSPILTSTVRELLHILWVIVVSKAMQVQFPIYKTTVAVFNDPLEDWHQALLRVFTKANAAQVTAFWDSLEGDLQDWVSILSEHQKLVFLNQVSLRIHWR